MAQSGRLWTDIDQSAWVDAGSGARLGRGRLNDPLQGRLLSMVMLEVGLRQSGGPEGLADRAEIPLPDVRCSNAVAPVPQDSQKVRREQCTRLARRRGTGFRAAEADDAQS